MLTTQNFLDILQGLEPKFIEAGKLAFSMQKGVKFHNKYNTGNKYADIVTEADLATQEFILKEMIKTDLVNARLLAEENTSLITKFNENGKYFLGMDPIDGTANYSKGGKVFSTIISFQDGKDILYMFGYYPALDWYYKVVNNVYSSSGKISDSVLPHDLGNTVVYWGTGNIEEDIQGEVYDSLINKNISFRKAHDLGDDMDIITLVASELPAGVYNKNPNVYDGIAELAIAAAKGWKLYLGGPNGKFDLSNIQKREIGFYYPGYYFALK